MGIVFDDGDFFAIREGQDRVHLAADAGVVDDDDGFGLGSDQGGKFGFVDVERVAADVGEDGFFAPRRTKALAVETKVKEGTMTSSPGFRFRRIAAISRAWVQEVVSIRALHAQEGFEHGVAGFGEAAVAGDVHAIERAGHVIRTRGP